MEMETSFERVAKMRRVRMLVILVVAWGLIRSEGEISEATPMGTAFTYQGRLIDDSEAADGLYDFEFRLFNLESGGSQLGGAVVVDELDVIDGYFDVTLDFGGGVFDGDGRWLQIGVRPGEQRDPDVYTALSPRQKMTPAPYALYAASGPGVEVPLVLSGSDSGPIVSGSNSGSGDGVYGRHSTSGTGAGVRGVSDSTSSSAVGVVGEIKSISPGGYSVGVRGINNGTGGLGIGVWGSQAGSGWGVYGTSVNGIGVFGYGSSSEDVGNYGGFFQAGGSSGRGVYGKASNSGNAENYGGYFEAAGNTGRGVYGKATGKFGRGVSGYATDSSLVVNYGGYFEAAAAGGRGVYGRASDSGDVTNYGGHFEAAGNKGRGVYGRASNSGTGTNYGGFFEAAGTKGVAVYGRAFNTGSNINYGGQFRADGLYAMAVYGFASNTQAGGKYGGYFAAAGYGGVGVAGRADDGIGVRGFAGSSTGIGVSGEGGQYDFYADGPGINYGSLSSIRWKSDIRAIEDPLAKVLNLRGVYYTWDAEHGGRHDMGMIAEEVGEVLPEIVGYEENGIDAKGMDYSKLTPLLVEAVKALKEQADEREKRLSQKDVEIKALTDRLSKVELLQRENADLYSRIEKLETMMAVAVGNGKGDR